MSVMPFFDAWIFCDWSASSTPKTGRDSIWICRGRDLVNPPTRAAAHVQLRAWLLAAEKKNQRVLVGWDFTLGLPALAYRQFGLDGWRAYWSLLRARIVDGPRNENNRVEVARFLNAERAGPFWGGAVSSKKPPADPRFPELRAVEHAMRARGLRPFSPWQLYGNGAVGSQSLMGIPIVHALRHDRTLAASRVWPFERGWESLRPLVLHVEAGPMVIDVDPSRHAVRDAAQMIALAKWAAREDRAGRLLPHLLSVRSRVARAEGWVLGIDP